jgi:hypothetical protein
MKTRAVSTFGVAALAMLVAAALVPVDATARPVKQPLHPTVADQNAQGRAVVSIHRAGKKMQGKMLVVGHNLTPSATFGVSVAGVRIGQFTTNGAGSGAARFSSQPTGHAQLLGVDPRGKLLEVSDDQGEDVMETDVPDDDTMEDAGDIQCCLPDDDGTECEETSPDECTAENGTNIGAGSCFPDPCQATPPPPEEDIVCCIPDSEEPECDETDAADCAAENGVNLGAGICDPNPCAPSPPANVVQCCISQGDQGEQEGEPQTEPPDCEELTADNCTMAGGMAIGTGSCDPNPCSAPATTTTTLP